MVYKYEVSMGNIAEKMVKIQSKLHSCNLPKGEV